MLWHLVARITANHHFSLRITNCQTSVKSTNGTGVASAHTFSVCSPQNVNSFKCALEKSLHRQFQSGKSHFVWCTYAISVRNVLLLLKIVYNIADRAMHDLADGVWWNNTGSSSDAMQAFLSTAINAANEPAEFEPCDFVDAATFNCSELEFVQYERGERVASLWLAIPVTMSYTLILLAGIIGNASVCIVIAQNRNRSMHTSTNYYLFNLAIADLLYLLFGLPFEIHMFWHQYPWIFGLAFCKFRSLATEACSYASVLTIVAFSVERYIAICHPLYSYVMANLKRVIYVIILIWLLSLLSASPVAYLRFVQFLRYPASGIELPDSGICIMRTDFAGLYETSSMAFFVIPLLVIIVMYAQVATKLNLRLGRFGKRATDANSKQLKATRNIVRMLIVIVITFFISWAPFHAQRLVFTYGQHWSNYTAINEFLFTIGGCFYYLSCTINPIIYNVMSHRYRTSFRQTFSCGSSTINEPTT